MTTLTKLRARVSPQAISKVTRIFNGTLDDIFAELFQNARRAGATRVVVTAEHLEDACLITVVDDGAGIDDPVDLVSLEVPRFADLEPGAAIYDDTDSFDAVTFGRALRRSAADEPHKLAGPEPLAFYEPITNFIGYPWYDAIRCFVRTGECFTHDGGAPAEGDEALTLRPDAIRLELTDQHGRRLDIETDFAIQESDDCWGDPDNARIALTQSSELSPDDLTDLIIDAVFSPSDDSDADSYDTQETRFRHDAAVRAHAILEGEDAAIIAGIRMAFADRIAWRIPHGRTLSLTWSREGSQLQLVDAGEGQSQ